MKTKIEKLFDYIADRIKHASSDRSLTAYTLVQGFIQNTFDYNKWTLNDFVENVFIPFNLRLVTWSINDFKFPEKELLSDGCRKITLVSVKPSALSYFKISEYITADNKTLFLIQH